MNTSPTIQVFERMFLLVDILAKRSQALNLKEISELAKLHPSTTRRILSDLMLGRYVERSDAGTYRLGLRLLELGNLVKSRLDVREAALGPMRALHDQLGQPVNLSVRQGDAIVYIDRAYSERSGMQVVRAIGGRAPLHLTSVGKLFLSQDTDEQLKAYASRTGLKGQTPNSITNLEVLKKELRSVAKTLAAYDKEELELGVRCIASAIHNDQGELIAGLSISAPTERLKNEWLVVLQDTTEAISAALGYQA
ncbi:MAG: IclR family transcriptional regulator [Cytophagales bacterium]|nr:IclR family transcriptional regulator [Cytophagales bacterium]